LHEVGYSYRFIERLGGAMIPMLLSKVNPPLRLRRFGVTGPLSQLRRFGVTGPLSQLRRFRVTGPKRGRDTEASGGGQTAGEPLR
jgi:hypothetical protein